MMRAFTPTVPRRGAARDRQIRAGFLIIGCMNEMGLVLDGQHMETMFDFSFSFAVGRFVSN